MNPVPELPDPERVRSFLATYKYPLLALGSLTLVALVLSSVARRRGVFPDRHGDPNTLAGSVQFSADWEASLRHLAAACDQRFAGVDQQLRSLHDAVGTVPTALHPSATVAPNGQAPNLSYEAAVADQPDNIPPSPASVSLP
jgi:hypothetical protein